MACYEKQSQDNVYDLYNLEADPSHVRIFFGFFFTPAKGAIQDHPQKWVEKPTRVVARAHTRKWEK